MRLSRLPICLPRFAGNGVSNTLTKNGGFDLPKLEAYDKQLDYSYALGTYTALKLMEYRPEAARRLLLSSDARDNDGINHLREICEAAGVREETADRVLRRESKKDNCFAAIVFEKYSDALCAAAPHIMLHHISDGGNLGSILRSCLGFGIKDIAIILPAADVFEPRSVRASMGALFAMRVRAFDSFEAYAAEFADRAFYMFMTGGATSLAEASRNAPEKYSLVFGNEQSGLPDELVAMGQSVYIPQSDAIDSLNLAAAAAIGVYAFSIKGV
jgi:TrmH family RNA methyltransferase